MAQSLGLGVENEGAVAEAIRNMDTDGDGEVSLEEFAAWWRSDEAGSLLKKELLLKYGASAKKLSGATGVAFG